jgi:hypothetical protein
VECGVQKVSSVRSNGGSASRLEAVAWLMVALVTGVRGGRAELVGNRQQQRIGLASFWGTANRSSGLGSGRDKTSSGRSPADRG